MDDVKAKYLVHESDVDIEKGGKKEDIELFEFDEKAFENVTEVINDMNLNIQRLISNNISNPKLEQQFDAINSSPILAKMKENEPYDAEEGEKLKEDIRMLWI